MAYYLMRPDGGQTHLAPSLLERYDCEDAPTSRSLTWDKSAGSQGELKNPTVIPEEILIGFKFAFLIRHPCKSTPSFFRCTQPPLDEVTRWHVFLPSEAGYLEVRKFFDYLCSLKGLDVKAGDTNNEEIRQEIKKQICIIDADDLLDHPAIAVRAFCESVGLEYNPDMLRWNTQQDEEQAEKAFEKWKGWHEDALRSKGLTPRQHVSLPPL